MIFFSKTMRQRTWLLLLSYFLTGQFVFSQEFIFPSSEKKMMNIPTSWEVVPLGERVLLLKMLLKTSESTISKINTINGIYSVAYEQAMAGDFFQTEGLSSVAEPAVIQYYDFLLQFCVEKKQNRRFYAKQVVRQVFTNKGKEFLPKNFVIVNENSTITNEDYLYTKISSSVIPTVVELSDFPSLADKKIAWRESIESAKRRSLVDFIDPFEYFNCSTWANLDFILSTLEGKRGEDKKNTANERLSFFESLDKQGKKWFRYYQRIQSSQDPLGYRELNIFWNEESGFHPVCKVYTSSSNAVVSLLQLQWERAGGLYYPVESQIVVYKGDGTLSYRRKMKASDLTINQPIARGQFAYSALGLGDGDILVDRIKQCVYTIQNDKPVYLAKFYEKYQTPREKGINRVRIFMMVLGVMMIALGIYLKIRRKNKESKE